jgi:hypothetical protein
MAWIKALLTWLLGPIEVESYDPHIDPEILVKAPEPIVEVKAPPDPVLSPRERLYQVAYDSLGKDMRADKSVPKELGCATSMSKVLQLAGVKELPTKGIPGTAKLYEWLSKSKQFTRITSGDVRPGMIICYPTGYDDPAVPGLPVLANGHVFIKGKYQLLSNNSATGLWDNHWESMAKADAYYTKYGGIPRYVFDFVG